MKVVVTGGAGFIGSHIAETLHVAGHDVTVVDDLSTGDRANVPGFVRFVPLDITKPDLISRFREWAPDAVIHCAAQVRVSASTQDPMSDLQRNAVGTVNLLSACRAGGTRQLICASTAAVYGAPQGLPITEAHPTRPLSPYGISKLAGESYVRVLGGDLGLRWVVLRYANVYGPRQKASGDGAVVPAFLHAMLAGREPLVHGDGSQTRDFIYVQDVCAANLAALTGKACGEYHVSTGKAIRILDLWHLCKEITGWNRAPVYAPARPGDIPHSVLSGDLARQQLKWQARTDLGSGLEATAAYWRAAVGK